VCGPKGKHDPARAAVRYGIERGSVTLGGRRVPGERPRVRAADGSGDLLAPAYELFSCTEVLGRMAMQGMLAGLFPRRYPVGLEPVGQRVKQSARSTSKSAVSCRFVAATETALGDLLAEPLGELDLVALMIDGVHLGDHLCVVALGIDGTKRPLGLGEGSTENTSVVADLLTRVGERGLATTRPIFVGIDGGKALWGGTGRPPRLNTGAHQPTRKPNEGGKIRLTDRRRQAHQARERASAQTTTASTFAAPPTWGCCVVCATPTLGQARAPGT